MSNLKICNKFKSRPHQQAQAQAYKHFKLVLGVDAEDDNLLDLQHTKHHLFTNMLAMVGKAS